MPVSQESFILLGFKIGEKYFHDKSLPMGLSVSCQWFELFFGTLHWILKHKIGVMGQLIFSMIFCSWDYQSLSIVIILWKFFMPVQFQLSTQSLSDPATTLQF